MTATIRPNIFPALRYHDARAAIDWLTGAFGFETDVVFDAPDGSVAHAQLHFGSGVVSLSSARQTPSDNPWAHVRQGLYVRVDEVDAHHARAARAGADSVVPLKDLDYGSREYSVRDPEGHLWCFGTYDMAGAHTGDPSIFAGLHYRDTRAALAWLEHALGFEKTLEVPAPDGSIRHAEMRLGAGTIMLGPGPKDVATWGDRSQGLCVYLPDPDPHCARAKDAGARIIQEPADAPYGARGYHAHDPEGFLWGFSTYRPSLSAVA